VGFIFVVATKKVHRFLVVGKKCTQIFGSEKKKVHRFCVVEKIAKTLAGEVTRRWECEWAKYGGDWWVGEQEEEFGLAFISKGKFCWNTVKF
jgi:hypothetical protein